MVTTTPTSNLNDILGTNPGLARLYDNVMAQVPAVGLALVKLAAWNTIEQFYIRSTARREIVYWTMATGVQSIDFNPFDSNWLVAWVLDLTGLSQFTVRMPAFVTDVAANGATGPRTGTAMVALKPVSLNSQLPPELFQQWFEAILSGVLFKLYSMPAKPFSSPQLAAFYAKEFKRGIGEARAIASHNYTGASGGNWNFPRTQGFAVGRRKN